MSEDFYYNVAIFGFSFFTVLIWTHYFCSNSKCKEDNYLTTNAVAFFVFLLWPVVVFIGLLVLIAYVLSRLIKLVFRT